METQNENRGIKRYPVQGGAIVYLKKKSFSLFNSNRYIQLGQISDISTQGMSIQYYSRKEIVDDFLGLAISTTSGKIIVDNISFETVYDIEIGNLPDGKKIRKKALKFTDVSGYQSAWLACMIHNLKSRQDELSVPSSHDEKPEILREIH